MYSLLLALLAQPTKSPALSPAKSSTALAGKPPLNHSVYDGWNAIRGQALSEDGKWIAYGTYPQEGDGTLSIKAVNSGSQDRKTYTVKRGAPGNFTEDSKFYCCLQTPSLASVKAARAAKLPAPTSNLVIVDLESSKQFEHAAVTSFRVAEHGSAWLAYQLAPEKPAAAPGSPAAGPRRRAGAGRPAPAAAANGGPATSTWVIRNLETGRETNLVNVTDLAWDRAGTQVSFVSLDASKAAEGSSAKPIDQPAGSEGGEPRVSIKPTFKLTILHLTSADANSDETEAVDTGRGRISRLAFSRQGDQLAYLAGAATTPAKPTPLALFDYRVGSKKPHLVAEQGSKSLPKSWAPSDDPVSFSASGKRLIFSTAPVPAPVEKSLVADDEKAQLDVWNWQDAKLMSQQIFDVERDKKRSYEAIADLGSGKLTQVARPSSPVVQIGDKNDASFGFINNPLPYELESSWDSGKTDLGRMNLDSGEITPLLAGHRTDALLNPSGTTAVVFDLATHTLTAFDLSSGRGTILKLPETELVDREDDRPDLAPAYGVGPFVKGGSEVVVHDKNDLWLVDVTGKEAATCLTQGFGHRWGYRINLEPSDIDPELGTLDLAKPLLLSVRNLDDESTGVYRLEGHTLTKLVYGPKLYAVAASAKKADTLAITESTFQEFPDLWLTNKSWEEPVRISDANPQQEFFLWGNCELVKWIGNDGQPLKGLLFKPEGMDYTKKYPMITYYYERDSATMYSYRAPAPSASTINIPYFVSNGYVVFVPDITYTVGYPGPSAFSSIVPGVQSIVARGFVDPKRLGLQGQSWGGYETAYLVTQTNMFAAASSGAPVGDMFSAYGGIRGESGVVREGQYEHGQSRIGGTPWERPMQYLQNSPVFSADRIKTPLLIMSNDADGAVPHTQGIEFFTDLRRLGKPSWMLVYNNEAHNLMERRSRKDLSVRLGQFFDHYLKGTAMPVWMSKGLPAVDKGSTYGFELEK